MSLSMVLSRVMVGVFVLCLSFFMSAASHARDSQLMLPVDVVLSEFSDRIDPDIALYFGDKKTAEIVSRHGIFTTNKKTNAFGKADDVACRWAMLSALLQLQERAKSEGANAVVGIVSYYKKNTVSSETEYECHAGNVVAGVALQGKMVVLK